MKKLTSLLMATVLFGFVSVVHANTLQTSLLWPESMDNEGLEDGIYVFSRLQSWHGDFSDTWGFSLGEDGGLPYQVEIDIENVPSLPSAFPAGYLYNITNLQLVLTDASDNVLATIVAGDSLVVPTLLNAGEWYTLTITGTVPGTVAGGGLWGGQYLGNLTVQEVPLPAAAWLFGTALLGLAGIARRRSV